MEAEVHPPGRSRPQSAVGSSFSRVLRNGGCQDSWPLWQATMGGLRGVLPVACSTVAAT